MSDSNTGVLLGYFYGPKLSSVPSGDIVKSLIPSKALKVIKFGDLSLMNKEWPVIGDIPNWHRRDWPLPEFVQKDDISKKAWRIRYSDDNVSQAVSQTPEPFNSPLERSSLYGAGAVEIVLTKLLS